MFWKLGLLLSGKIMKPTLLGPLVGINFYLMAKVEPASKILCLFAKNQMTENVQHMWQLLMGLEI